MKKGFFGFVVILTVFGIVAGCAETQFSPYAEAKGEAETLPFAPRRVFFEVTREFLVDMPDCIVVLPPKAEKEGQKHYARLVERELTGALRSKISRIVGSTQRRISARELALPQGLTNPAGRRLLAGHLDCNALVFSEIQGGLTNALVWSSVKMTVDVRMEASDGKILWRAKTEASRSDGGVPLSPLSILTNGFNAARFAADQSDISESVISDAVRRIVHTIPDARRFETARERRQ